VNEKPLHWAQVGEVGFVMGMQLMFWIYRLLGRWPFRAILGPVVLYYALRHRVARRASQQYFRKLQASAADPKTETTGPGFSTHFADTLRHFFSFSETLLDKALAVSGHFRFDELQFEGRELMIESMERRQGGVLITAHMGCLEVCRLAATRKNGPILNVLMHTKHAERFNTVLKKLDPHTTVRLLQVTEFSVGVAVLLSERVAKGEFVVIAGDRVSVGRAEPSVEAMFLGTLAPFPLGPWILAAALKCQVLLFTVLHRPTGGYQVTFEKLADRVELPRKNRLSAATRYVERYAEKLSQRCRQSPYDWFNFYPFWSESSLPSAAPEKSTDGGGVTPNAFH
jgi:predicted LPLAT superfamily acyltransferase